MEKVKVFGVGICLFGLFAYTDCAAYQSFLMTVFNGNPNPFAQISGHSSSEILLTIKTGQSLRCAGLCLATFGCTAFHYDASAAQSLDCQLLKLLTQVNLSEGVASGNNQFYAAVTAEVRRMQEIGQGRNVTFSSYYSAPSNSACVTNSLMCVPRCVKDGLASTIWHSSTTDSKPWIAIKLIYDHLVYSVNVTARCDNAFSQLHDFDVRIGEDVMADTNGYVNGALCAHWTGAYTISCQKETFLCPALLRGSVVSVQTTKLNAGVLSIAEVSILGYPLQTS